MRFMLIVPRIVNRIGDSYQFPSGIAYISSSLKEAGFEVINLNLNHVHGEVGDILSEEFLKKVSMLS